MCSAQCGGTTEYFLPLQQLSGQHDGQLQPAVAQVLPIHVSIAKVSLLAKEKGFRCSMRATEAAQVFTSQVNGGRSSHITLLWLHNMHRAAGPGWSVMLGLCGSLRHAVQAVGHMAARPVCLTFPRSTMPII